MWRGPTGGQIRGGAGRGGAVKALLLDAARDASSSPANAEPRAARPDRYVICRTKAITASRPGHRAFAQTTFKLRASLVTARKSPAPPLGGPARALLAGRDGPRRLDALPLAGRGGPRRLAAIPLAALIQGLMASGVAQRAARPGR